MSKKLTIEELFQKLSDQLGVSVEQLKEDYKATVEEVKKDERFVGIEEERVHIIARNQFTTKKRRELASPAVTWEGKVAGVGDLVDAVFRQRQLTEAAFKASPEQTKKGWNYASRLVLADENGKALYPKTPNNDKWRRTGKPLPDHSWLRNVFGGAAPIDKKTRQAGEPRPFTMTLSGNRAVNAGKLIKMNIPTKFKGINKTTDEDNKAGIYRISDSVFTKFEEAPALKLPPTETFLTTLCSSKFISLGELEEYHATAANVPDRWIVTEGTVSVLNLEPNAVTQNLRMVLDDESLLFSPPKEGGRIGVTCWIPTDRNIEIDFAQDSRIYVIGKTTQGKKYDPITNQKTDEPGDVMINVYGIYCPEMFKVKLEPQKLPETALEVVKETELPSKESAEEAW